MHSFAYEILFYARVDVTFNSRYLHIAPKNNYNSCVKFKIENKFKFHAPRITTNTTSRSSPTPSYTNTIHIHTRNPQTYRGAMLQENAVRTANFHPRGARAQYLQLREENAGRVERATRCVLPSPHAAYLR